MSSLDDKKPKTTITSSAEGKGGRLTVKLSVAPRAGTPSPEQIFATSRYELGAGYVVPESLKGMIPSKVQDYLDEGDGYVERIMRALFYFKQSALIGPNGTGKSHAIYLVAQTAGLPLWEINCGLQTSTDDLFGKSVGPQKENGTEGTVVSWYRQGGILYLDEANMMTQDIATRINPLLDTREQIVLTEKGNEVVRRHPSAYAVISMNSYAPGFSANTPLQAMFRKRMSVWIDFDYLSVGIKISPGEVKIISERAKIPMDIAAKVVRVGAEARKMHKNGDLPFGPSVGDLVNWATLIAGGLSPKEAAHETFISLAADNPEIQAIVSGIVTMVFREEDSEPAEKTENP